MVHIMNLDFNINIKTIRITISAITLTHTITSVTNVWFMNVCVKNLYTIIPFEVCW